MSLTITVEMNENFKKAKDTIYTGAGTILFTPPLDGDYWIFRVRLYEDQALLVFPKFGILGCGFAQEADWNTNLPIKCPAEQIYAHIKHNKKYKQISEQDCLDALIALQKVAIPYMEKHMR